MHFTALVGTILVLTIIPNNVIGIENGDCSREICDIRTAITRGAIALVNMIAKAKLHIPSTIKTDYIPCSIH